jgi:hypothetical protein
MAAAVAVVEQGLIPNKSPPRAQDGGFLPAEGVATWSEWRTDAEAPLVPL